MTERPDLDKAEQEIRDARCTSKRTGLELIAYARHLERTLEDERAARTVVPQEVFDKLLNEISDGEVEEQKKRADKAEAEVERLRGLVLEELSAESQRLGLPE